MAEVFCRKEQVLGSVWGKWTGEFIPKEYTIFFCGLEGKEEMHQALSATSMYQTEAQ